MAVRLGDEWHWLVRNRRGRDLAKGFAYGPVEARSEAEAAATQADDDRILRTAPQAAGPGSDMVS
jgi:hypothetical protein